MVAMKINIGTMIRSGNFDLNLSSTAQSVPLKNLLQKTFSLHINNDSAILTTKSGTIIIDAVFTRNLNNIQSKKTTYRIFIIIIHKLLITMVRIGPTKIQVMEV